MKRGHKFLSIGVCVLLTSSCASGGALDPKKHDVIDRAGGLTRDDYQNMFNANQPQPGEVGKPKIVANVMEPPVPDLAEILASPQPPKLGETQMVSIAVTDDVPLKDVLIELARLADVDIEVDAGISGGIAFRAKNRPFNEVIERIADLAGLRYTMKDNVLRVERDTPYIQTYTLNMLNIDRSANGNIGVSTSGGGSGGSSSSSGGSSGGSSSSGSSSSGSGGSGSSSSSGASSSSGSSSNITATSTSDFWAKFEDSVGKVLAAPQGSRLSAASVASQPVVNNAATPGAPATPAAAPAAAPAATGTSKDIFYSLNRQAGTLTVSGTERQQDVIRRFIKAIEANASSQVLIEAKIVEVQLNDHYQTGIDWTQFGTSKVGFAADFNKVTPAGTGITPATITLIKNNAIGGVDLSAAVHLLDEFGTTRALSSPRLNAINNQQAVLSFVENLLYFQVQCKVTDAVPAPVGSTTPGTPAKVDVTSTPETAPVGIVLTLQPSINKSTSEITLSVRPTLTKKTADIPDPGFELCKAQAASQPDIPASVVATLNGITAKFPQLETREMDSILKIKSGQVMVIGGLLEDTVTNSDSGVPGVSEVPYFGNLFKSVDKSNVKKELVIMIRATIIGNTGFVDKADKDLYQKFMQDPSPIQFPEQ